MRTWILVGALSLLGCPRESSSTAPPEAVPGSTPAPKIERGEPDPGVGPTTQASSSPRVGWESIADPTDEATDRLWRRARSAERKGDAARALEAYAAALDRAPSRSDVRMAYAQRLAHQGQLDAAWTQLLQTLREDLPQHRGEALTSEALAPLRRRPQWAPSLAAIEAAYADTLSRGVPAFTYVPRDGWVDGEYGGTPQTPYTHVRVGLYDLKTRRFVPMVPAVARTFTGFIDRDRKRALVVRGDLKRKNMWTVKPDRNRAIVYSLESWGTVVFQARGVARDTRFEEWDAFGVWLGEDDASLWVRREETYAGNSETMLWNGSGKTLVARRQWHGENDIDAPPEFPSRAPDVWVGEDASANDPSTQGGSPTAATIRDETWLVPSKLGTPIELEPGHDANSFVVASPLDPDVLVAFRTMDPPTPNLPGEDEAIPPHMKDVHAIDVIDLERETIWRISSGPGSAFMAWAPDGSVVFETPSRLVRCSPPGYEPLEDIPAGVHFGTPHFPEEGGV